MKEKLQQKKGPVRVSTFRSKEEMRQLKIFSKLSTRMPEKPGPEGTGNVAGPFRPRYGG